MDERLELTENEISIVLYAANEDQISRFCNSVFDNVIGIRNLRVNLPKYISLDGNSRIIENINYLRSSTEIIKDEIGKVFGRGIIKTLEELTSHFKTE